jgi:hypothetical protein
VTGTCQKQTILNTQHQWQVPRVIVCLQFIRPGTNHLDDQLVSQLQQNSGNDFVRFYSAWDARSRRIRVDNEITMQFVNMDLGRVFDNHETRKVTRKVVVKETVYRPDSVVREYANVQATITTTNRSLRSAATLQVIVRDENGRRIWTDTYSSAHN